MKLCRPFVLNDHRVPALARRYPKHCFTMMCLKCIYLHDVSTGCCLDQHHPCPHIGQPTPLTASFQDGEEQNKIMALDRPRSWFGLPLIIKKYFRKKRIPLIIKGSSVQIQRARSNQPFPLGKKTRTRPGPGSDHGQTTVLVWFSSSPS